MADNKDTIYIDIDDEITALIDKVKSSNARVLALVLPKRATVLQSIVNMKLLKRTADNEKKNIVLITTESGLLPLAGAVGMYVANSLSSKPEIPSAPSMAGAETDTVDEDFAIPLDDEEVPDLTKTSAKGASVGVLSDAASHKKSPVSKAIDALETVELDNEDGVTPENDEPSEPEPETKKSKKEKKDKHLKVPNFDRFRLLLIIGLLVIIGLVVLGVFAFSVWPKATINIKTDASTVNASANLTLDPQAQTTDVQTGDIPAKQVSMQKTFSQTVNTTGQKNEGNIASGNVTFSLNDCQGDYFGSPSFTIPAGTGVSYNNLTFITQTDVVMKSGKPNFTGSGFCVPYKSENGAVAINAQSPGSQYNTQITNGVVSNYPEVQVNGTTSGGTDNMVQIVAQADITSATSKINANNSGAVKQDLINELKGEGMYPIAVSLAAGSPQTTSNPNVGVASNTVTVTETVTYTMYGVRVANLQSILASNIHSQTAKSQNIISYGINQGAFKQSGTSGATDEVSVSTLATVGPNISLANIKKQAAGKSPQSIISTIRSNPNVTSVTVRLSPFWVTSAPTNTSKIMVNIAKPGKSA